jgi:hypothetical protein
MKNSIFARLFAGKTEAHPISALITALINAAHRSAKKLIQFGDVEVFNEEGGLKKEHLPRYEMLFSEILYFYMHLMLRLAHGQGFSEPEITTLQNRFFPPIIEGVVEGAMGHWPEEAKAKIKAEHYQNMDSAEFEYGSCKEVYPIDDGRAEGKSAYATFARNIEKQLGRSHSPNLSLRIIWEASKQLRAQRLPKLLASVREFCI